MEIFLYLSIFFDKINLIEKKMGGENEWTTLE